MELIEVWTLFSNRVAPYLVSCHFLPGDKGQMWPKPPAVNKASDLLGMQLKDGAFQLGDHIVNAQFLDENLFYKQV